VRVRDIDWRTWQAKDPATLVFVVKDSSILLIRKKRGLGAGKINAPGGRLEPGETPLEAAVREAQEEVGITPLDLNFAGLNLFQFVDGYSIHVHVFKALDFEGDIRETEEASPLWTPVDRIPYEEMWADDRLWIPLVLEGVRFQGRYIFDGDVMLDYELEPDPA
jgi:8-oxo-dGTP diphosphatase